MKLPIKTSLLLALMLSCNIGSTQIPLGMRTDVDWELIEAAKLGDMQEVARLLEEQGADIETRDYNDEDDYDDTEYTPLHHACEQGHQEVVAYLVGKGADVNAKTFRKSRTPLHYACIDGHLEIVKFLINNKADVNARTSTNGTPLHCAARAGHLDIVQYFHSIDVDMNPQDRDGLTLLHSAAASGNLELVKYLQKNLSKENIMAQTASLMTPLHFAAILGHKDVVEFFVSIAKELINLKSKHGNTALHFAADKGHEEVVKSLLSAGADTIVKDNKGATPLARARRKRHTAIITLLQQAMADQEISHKRDSSPPVPPTQPLPKRSKHAVEIH